MLDNALDNVCHCLQPLRRTSLFEHLDCTLPFKSLGSLRNVLVFHENIHEMNYKMNRKYSQDVDKVINNDF